MNLFSHYRLRACIVMVFSLFVTACASELLKPEVDYKHDYDFSHVKKVAFYAGSGQVTGDNTMELSDMQKDRVNRALAYALGNKGIAIVENPADADLLLSWHLVTQFKTDVTTFNDPSMYAPFYGYNRYAMYNCWSCMDGPDVITQNYTDGYFIVDMIDPTLHQSVWRSTIHSRLTGNDDLKDQEKINATAVILMSDFPPGSAPAN